MRAKFGIAVMLLAACGGSDRAAGARPAPVEPTAGAARGATAAEPAPGRPGVPRVLFIGTSLTAGYGLDDPGRDAYPAVIQRLADSAGVKAFVVNAGLSGETSAGALRRGGWRLRGQTAGGSRRERTTACAGSIRIQRPVTSVRSSAGYAR